MVSNRCKCKCSELLVPKMGKTGITILYLFYLSFALDVHHIYTYTCLTPVRHWFCIGFALVLPFTPRIHLFYTYTYTRTGPPRLFSAFNSNYDLIFYWWFNSNFDEHQWPHDSHFCLISSLARLMMLNTEDILTCELSPQVKINHFFKKSTFHQQKSTFHKQYVNTCFYINIKCTFCQRKINKKQPKFWYINTVSIWGFIHQHILTQHQ